MKIMTFLPVLNGYYEIYIPKINLRKTSEKSETQQYNLNRQVRGRIRSKYRSFSYDNN
jgi:hypothetical protein